MRPRPADAPVQLLFSVVVVCGLMTVGHLTDDVILSKLIALEYDTRTIYLYAVLFAAVLLGAAVTLRARDGRRRVLAIGATLAYLGMTSVTPLVLGPTFDTTRAVELSWLLTVVSRAANLLAVTAWGLARRHGRWWWLGLLPALGVDLAQDDLLRAFLDVVPEEYWGRVFVIVPMAIPVLGALCCWAVDLATTRVAGSGLRGRLGT